VTTPIPWHYRDAETRLTGEIYRPESNANGKAVLVFHEADGIGGNVRRHSQMLADLGYIAAAADMHGKGRPLIGDEIAPALAAFIEDRNFLRRRAGAAYDALKAKYGLVSHEIAAIGYCFGGTAVLEMARAGKPLAAVASFHGLLTTSAPAPPGAVRSRILACTGARDPLVPLADVTSFQAEMAAAAADWQLCVFGRALHSFTNSAVDDLGDERMAFDPAAEEASWAMLRLFLERSFAQRRGVSSGD
jgi:dienelactone hydrolase